MTATNDSSIEGGDRALNAEPHFIELGKKIDVIYNKLEMLMQNVSDGSSMTSENVIDQTRPAARAIDLYGHRRRRVKLFGADLFGEPAWDILLDLFIATETGKQISVTSACIGAAVPLTTALRWLSMLEARGLIVRESDEKDARRSYVRLSDLGRELMDQYLSDS